MGEVAEKDATWANVGEPVANLCRRAVWLGHLIAPDLAGLPLYVVPQSALVDDLGSAEHAGGYTTPSLDLYLRDAIGSSWRGRGPCMVVNDINLRDVEPDDVELFFMAIVLHELAHIVERPVLFRERTDAAPARLLFESLAVANIVAEPATQDEENYALMQHGDRFTRAALHLQYRASQAGVEVGPALICAGYRYRMTHASAYRDALGDEPARMIGQRIEDVLATPPPTEFVRVWMSDHADWTIHNRSQPKEFA